MYTASCHCGSVRLEMERKPRLLTACNCSICRRYGAIWAYFQRRSFRVECEPGILVRYRWGRKRFEFFHCQKCGCISHYERTSKRSDGSDMAAVNMRNIDDPSIVNSLPVKLLDGSGSWATLKRCPLPEIFGDKQD